MTNPRKDRKEREFKTRRQFMNLQSKQKLISDIKLEALKLTTKTDEELIYEIGKIKKRKNPLIEWFAVVQEISFRKIGLRHFDTQLLAGLILHEGKIVEMKTGEGKTLVSTLPVSFNALEGKGVHVVTVNEYLAERDKKWMGKIYQALGLTTGLVKMTSSKSQKLQNYNCDITYLTNSELVFDYLRDISCYHLNQMVQRPFNFCLLDEVDSILIDEARTPLILSSPSKTISFEKLYLAKKVARLLQKEIDFEIDEKRREIHLTEVGYKKVVKSLGKTTLYDVTDPWAMEILNALKANYLFQKNKDYIVQKNKILIVDEFTGRIMEDRRWGLGVHEAIEMKEDVPLRSGTKTKSSITYQNFFPFYPKLAGMTGTAKTNEEEFKEIYNLKVVSIPTRKPMIREDASDIIFGNERAKWLAVLTEAQKAFHQGRPILIGTNTIEKSELLADLFTASQISHQVLNAKPENVKRESEIVAQAGQRYAVTIATNMAGRGTDIILGGNPIFKVKQKIKYEISHYIKRWQEEIKKNKLQKDLTYEISQSSSLQNEDIFQILPLFNEYKWNLSELESHIENLPYSLDECKFSLKSLYQSLYTKISQIWSSENKIVKELGGLLVLGTERNENRRIDDQLRGRSGRQGDPGRSQFFVSLQDDLLKIFGGEKLENWMTFFNQDENMTLDAPFLTKSLENAQQKLERYNYEIRKNIFQYDNIVNFQRKQIFKIRSKLLIGKIYGIYENLLLRSHETSFDEIFPIYRKLKQKNSPKIFEKISSDYEIDYLMDSYASYANSSHYQNIYQANSSRSSSINQFKKNFSKEIWVTNDLIFAESNFYQVDFFKNTRVKKILKSIDFYWTEHIQRIDYIKETINWRSYGQENPLIEYNLQASESLKGMLQELRKYLIYYFTNSSNLV